MFSYCCRGDAFVTLPLNYHVPVVLYCCKGNDLVTMPFNWHVPVVLYCCRSDPLVTLSYHISVASCCCRSDGGYIQLGVEAGESSSVRAAVVPGHCCLSLTSSSYCTFPVSCLTRGAMGVSSWEGVVRGRRGQQLKFALCVCVHQDPSDAPGCPQVISRRLSEV